jgi:hypothetical protein
MARDRSGMVVAALLLIGALGVAVAALLTLGGLHAVLQMVGRLFGRA